MSLSTDLRDNIYVNDIEDSVTIFGVAYSGDLFRSFAMKRVEGELMSLGTRVDGVLDVHVYKPFDHLTH